MTSLDCFPYVLPEWFACKITKILAILTFQSLLCITTTQLCTKARARWPQYSIEITQNQLQVLYHTEIIQSIPLALIHCTTARVTLTHCNCTRIALLMLLWNQHHHIIWILCGIHYITHGCQLRVPITCKF